MKTNSLKLWTLGLGLTLSLTMLAGCGQTVRVDVHRTRTHHTRKVHVKRHRVPPPCPDPVIVHKSRVVRVEPRPPCRVKRVTRVRRVHPGPKRVTVHGSIRIED